MSIVLVAQDVRTFKYTKFEIRRGSLAALLHAIVSYYLLITDSSVFEQLAI